MNKAVLEGLLFVVGEDGLTLEQIGDVLNLDNEKSKELIMELKKDYEDETRGLRIDFLGNKFKITTKFEHKEYYQKLIQNPDTNTLSTTALEVLAIIAYNQPITRVEIDKMRGTPSAHMIRKLLAKGLVKTSGKSTMTGRPNLYATTSEFLDYFGLSSISNLPELRADEIVDEEKDLFTSIYKDEKEQDISV